MRFSWRSFAGLYISPPSVPFPARLLNRCRQAFFGSFSFFFFHCSLPFRKVESLGIRFLSKPIFEADSRSLYCFDLRAPFLSFLMDTFARPLQPIPGPGSCSTSFFVEVPPPTAPSRASSSLDLSIQIFFSLLAALIGLCFYFSSGSPRRGGLCTTAVLLIA